MKAARLPNWAAFTARLQELSEHLPKDPSGNSSELLFRGQSSSGWTLSTTLERADCEGMLFEDYYRLAVTRARPAVEAFTWELPAGLVENEEPAETCRRELLEETGLPALSVTLMGVTSPCTGRLSNRVYSYFVEAGDPIDAFVAEPGLSVKMVDAAELAALIKSGNFASQLHLGALMLAELHSFLHLPR